MVLTEQRPWIIAPRCADMSTPSDSPPRAAPTRSPLTGLFQRGKRGVAVLCSFPHLSTHDCDGVSDDRIKPMAAQCRNGFVRMRPLEAPSFPTGLLAHRKRAPTD